MTSDLYFYNQWEFRKIPRRFRKLPEDLPESLRFAHLNPKVAALLANKERIHKQEKEDPFGDGLGQKSLIPDINSAFTNVRNQFDSSLSNDEDSQRYLFEEAKFSAQGILEQLSRIIYFYEELYKHIPKSLEYQLMSGYKELTADVTVVPREWQTHEMKMQYALSLQHEGISDMEEFDDMSSRPRSRLDSSGRTPSEYGSRINLKKRGGPRLGVIAGSPDEDRLGLESRAGGRKTSVSRQSVMSQQQKLHPDGNPSRIGSRVRKGSSVSSHRSTLATMLGKKPDTNRSKSPTGLGTAKNKLKTAVSKVKVGNVLSGMSPSVYKGRIRDDQFSMIDETPSDLRSTALALPSSYMQTINFQLSNKSFEEKGWIMLKGLQEEVDPNAVLEYCVMKLQETMKQTAAIRQKEIELGYDKSVNVRYYGDTRKETILKFRKSPVRSSQNNVQKGGKPNIPSINDERNEGKKLMEVSHTDGTTVIYYPSGRPAIIYSAAGYGRPGYYTIVYNDGLDSKVLACFTPSGKGVCYHPNGVVRFLSTEKGGHVSEEDGALGRKWKWPQANIKITEPVSFQLNSHLLFRCIGRGQMTIVFNCHKEMARFSVSPSPGVEEYKIGEDTEQLLTAFTFSSKTAKDLMRIFAPTKKQKKSKGRKKLKPLIAGLMGKMYKDVTAKSSKEDSDSDKKDVSEIEKSPSKFQVDKSKSRKISPYKSVLLEVKAVAGIKLEVKKSAASKSEIDVDAKTEAKTEPNKIKTAKSSPRSKKSKETGEADNEKTTRPRSARKISKKEKAEKGKDEKVKRPRTSKRLSKESEKPESEMETDDTIRSTPLSNESKETQITETEKQEKVKRPRSSRKVKKGKGSEKTGTETEENVTESMPSKIPSTKDKSSEINIGEELVKSKSPKRSSDIKKAEKAEATNGEDQLKRPISSERLSTEDKSDTKIDVNLARPVSAKMLSTEEKSEAKIDVKLARTVSAKWLSAKDKSDKRIDGKLARPESSKRLSTEEKSDSRIDGKLASPGSSKRLSAEKKSDIRIDEKLARQGSSKRLSAEEKSDIKIDGKLARPVSSKRLSAEDKSETQLDAKLERPVSSKRLSDSKKFAKDETINSENQPTKPRSSKALSKGVKKSETNMETVEITSARSTENVIEGKETEVPETDTHEKLAVQGSSKSLSKEADKSVSKIETDKMAATALLSPRLSKSKKTVKAGSKTEMVTTAKSSPRLKASKTKSKIDIDNTRATAKSAVHLNASDKETKKVADINTGKSNVEIEIHVHLATAEEDSTKKSTPLEREESSNYLAVTPPVRRRRGAVQYITVEDSEDNLDTEEAEKKESGLEDEKQIEPSKSSIAQTLDISDIKASSPDGTTSQEKMEFKSMSVAHSRASLSAKETRNQLSVKEGRSTASAKEPRSSVPSAGKAASRGLFKDQAIKERGSSGEGRIDDIKSKPEGVEIKTEVDITQDMDENSQKARKWSDVSRKKGVTYAADLIGKSALKKGKASKTVEDGKSGKGEKKLDKDESDHTSKSQASDIVKLLSEFPDKVTYELEADKEHARLQRKARNLIDDWMEHYRIALGLSSPILETMSDSPPYSIATRHAKSAKQSEAGLMIRRAVLGVDEDDNVKRARVPSAPLAGREAWVNNLSSSPVIPSQFIKPRTPTPSIPPTPIPRLCLSGLSGEKYDDLDDDLLDIPLDYAAKRDSMVTFEEPGHAGGDSGLVPSAVAMINRMADTASRRSARSKASSARSISPSRQSVFTSMSERVPSALSGARSHCPLVIRQQILGYERPQCRCSRHHIPFITDIELDEYVSTEVPEGQLIIVMVVSSLFPGITKAEEMLNEIYQNQNRNRTRPCVQSRSDMFRVFKYDINTAAEMSDHTQPLLLTRHNVVPGMFLMYCDGKLLFCDHIFNGYGSARKDFKKQVMKSRHDAIQGYNLPKDFKFSPSRGKSGLRSAWGGEIGGAGVDKYSSPGTLLDSSLVPIHRPLSSSSGNSKEIQIEAVSSEFVDLGPFHKEITVRLKPLVTYRVPKQRLEEAASLLVTSLSTTGLQRVSLRPLVLQHHVPESTA